MPNCSISTPLAGVTNVAKAHGASVVYSLGCEQETNDTSMIAEAVEVAKSSDVVIAFLGLRNCQGGQGKGGPSCESEGHDRDAIGLPGVQQELLQQLHATGKPVVLVLSNGGPVAIPWAAQNIPAIVDAWYVKPPPCANRGVAVNVDLHCSLVLSWSEYCLQQEKHVRFVLRVSHARQQLPLPMIHFARDVYTHRRVCKRTRCQVRWRPRGHRACKRVVGCQRHLTCWTDAIPSASVCGATPRRARHVPHCSPARTHVSSLQCNAFVQLWLWPKVRAMLCEHTHEVPPPPPPPRSRASAPPLFSHIHFASPGRCCALQRELRLMGHIMIVTLTGVHCTRTLSALSCCAFVHHPQLVRLKYTCLCARSCTLVHARTYQLHNVPLQQAGGDTIGGQPRCATKLLGVHYCNQQRLSVKC
jgi:hypothetical protein